MSTSRQPILELDKPNVNGHIYSEATIREAIEKRKDKPLFGYAYVPGFGTDSLNRVSHLITDLSVEDGKLIGTVTVQDTPMGKIVGEIHPDRLLFTANGTGNVDEHGNISDYTLTSVSVENKPDRH